MVIVRSEGCDFLQCYTRRSLHCNLYIDKDYNHVTCCYGILNKYFSPRKDTNHYKYQIIGTFPVTRKHFHILLTRIYLCGQKSEVGVAQAGMAYISQVNTALICNCSITTIRNKLRIICICTHCIGIYIVVTTKVNVAALSSQNDTCTFE